MTCSGCRLQFNGTDVTLNTGSWQTVVGGSYVNGMGHGTLSGFNNIDLGSITWAVNSGSHGGCVSTTGQSGCHQQSGCRGDLYGLYGVNTAIFAVFPQASGTLSVQSGTTTIYSHVINSGNAIIYFPVIDSFRFGGDFANCGENKTRGVSVIIYDTPAMSGWEDWSTQVTLGCGSC